MSETTLAAAKSWKEILKKWDRATSMKARACLEESGLCGCGTNAHWEVVVELLEQSERQTAAGYEKDSRGFYVDKWHEFGAKVLDSWGWLEHGTGIGWAWLTDDGKLMLEFFRDFGTVAHGHPGSSGHPAWSAEFSWDENDREDDAYWEWVMSLGR